ncbi:MAG: T9SS type A sorting domain-containing protein [Saprospiraceae bacterium]
MKRLFLFCAILIASQASAQCPYFSTCPTDTLHFCDYSTNDTLYWKAAPHTWNPSLMRSDLPEADAEIGMVAGDTCGGQDILVDYTLFLDLDGNDTVETVIRSNAAPPSGKVLYNNFLSPNYTLGDTIEFDHRTGLPDSMKYRFGLEIIRTAGMVTANLKWTTGIEDLHYFTPNFPLGKHRILWRIEQGGVEQFCEYEIEVKDCAPPVVSCATLPTVNIMPTGLITLWASDFLSSAADNITPPDKLVIAVRKSGQSGIGFPLDLNGAPNTYVSFDCTEAYASWPIELWVKDLAGKTDSCLSYITVADYWCNCECGSHLNARARTPPPWNEGVEEVRFQVEGTTIFGPPFSYFDYSSSNGYGVFSWFPLVSNFVLTPSKNDNPLNGVTTYDLVLISKHILDVEPLNSPYKIIAADANKSGNISSFDIVEIRKLILGIHDTFPNNSSWRFVDESYVFPNTLNPFQTFFPEKVEQEDWLGNPNHFDFIGIKVGDVNNTAIPNATAPPPAESRATSFLGLPDLALKTGETVEIPIRSTESIDWLGFQFSLDFAPELVEIQAIESSTLLDFDQNNWAMPRVGRLNLSWSAASPASILPNDALLRLRIKARADIQLSKVFQIQENPALRPEAYDSEGATRALQFVFSENSTSQTTQIFDPQPNPTTAGVTLPVLLSEAENLRLEVRDLSGRLLWANDIKLEKGSHMLEIPASAMPQAGIYVWRVQAGEIMNLGKIMKG